MTYSVEQLQIACMAVSGFDKESEQMQEKAKEMFTFAMQFAAPIFIKSAAIALSMNGHIDAIPIVAEALKQVKHD